MRKLSYLGLVFYLLILFSCASAGKKIDMEAVQKKIIIGESTKEDVLGLCGEPLSKQYDSKNKSEVWHYAHVQKNVTWLGVITHIFIRIDEWKSETKILDVYFEKDVVVDMNFDNRNTKKFYTPY